eukprot:893-Alexandrium_andersonii.AAC.1
MARFLPRSLCGSVGRHVLGRSRGRGLRRRSSPLRLAARGRQAGAPVLRSAGRRRPSGPVPSLRGWRVWFRALARLAPRVVARASAVGRPVGD